MQHSCSSGSKRQLRTRAFDAPDTSNYIMSSPNRSIGITAEKFAVFGLAHLSRRIEYRGKTRKYVTGAHLPTLSLAHWGLQQLGPHRQIVPKYSFSISLN